MSGPIDGETPQETAEALIPGLQYLAREARDAGLVTVAGIIGRAASDVVLWIHENDDPPPEPPEAAGQVAGPEVAACSRAG